MELNDHHVVSVLVIWLLVSGFLVNVMCVGWGIVSVWRWWWKQEAVENQVMKDLTYRYTGVDADGKEIVPEDPIVINKHRYVEGAEFGLYYPWLTRDSAERLKKQLGVPVVVDLSHLKFDDPVPKFKEYFEIIYDDADLKSLADMDYLKAAHRKAIIFITGSTWEEIVGDNFIVINLRWFDFQMRDILRCKLLDMMEKNYNGYVTKAGLVYEWKITVE